MIVLDHPCANQIYKTWAEVDVLFAGVMIAADLFAIWENGERFIGVSRQPLQEFLDELKAERKAFPPQFVEERK
jgi:hypothetical protein